jgi:hypothetical protein
VSCHSLFWVKRRPFASLRACKRHSAWTSTHDARGVIVQRLLRELGWDASASVRNDCPDAIVVHMISIRQELHGVEQGTADKAVLSTLSICTLRLFAHKGCGLQFGCVLATEIMYPDSQGFPKLDGIEALWIARACRGRKWETLLSCRRDEEESRRRLTRSRLPPILSLWFCCHRL